VAVCDQRDQGPHAAGVRARHRRHVAAALAGRPALLGYLPAGGFRREMALEPDGKTLLVGNYTSGQLEAVTVADLP